LVSPTERQTEAARKKKKELIRSSFCTVQPILARP
jgi:hypothetical protein